MFSFNRIPWPLCTLPFKRRITNNGRVAINFRQNITAICISRRGEQRKISISIVWTEANLLFTVCLVIIEIGPIWVQFLNVIVLILCWKYPKNKSCQTAIGKEKRAHHRVWKTGLEKRSRELAELFLALFCETHFWAILCTGQNYGINISTNKLTSDAREGSGAKNARFAVYFLALSVNGGLESGAQWAPSLWHGE